MFEKTCSDCKRCLEYEGRYCEGKPEKCAQYASAKETKNFWLYAVSSKGGTKA